MVTRTLLSILRDSWLIDPSHARNLSGLVYNQLTGVIAVEEATEEEIKAEYFPRFYSSSGTRMASNQSSAPQEGVVAVLPIVGPITKEDQFCGPRGTVTMAAWLSDLERDPNVKAIVLSMDTPGGQSYGTQTLANAVANCKKPVVAFCNDGIIASAGYWIASQADQIVSSHETNMIGSIGAYQPVYDWYGYLRSQGLKIEDVYSNLSSEKNKVYKDAIQGNTDSLKQELDTLVTVFHNSVKAARGERIDASQGDPFKGGIYYSDQALKMGLIDSIGSFEQAVQLASSLADERQASASSSQTQQIPNTETMKINKVQTALLAALNLSVAEGEEHVEVELTDEAVQNLNSYMEGLNQRLTDAQTSANDWKQKAEEYGKASGRFPATPPKEGTDPIESSQEDDEFMTEVDREIERQRKLLYPGQD